jgi:hypothetical protein
LISPPLHKQCKETKWSVPWFDCDESLACRDLNLNLGHFGGFFLYLCSCGESSLIVSWCVGDRCDMAGSDENHGNSRRPSAEDRGWSSTGLVLGGQMIGRAGDAMCGMHRAHRYKERGFLG